MATWGRVDLNYDPEEAKREQEALRAEFKRNCQIASEDPEWPASLVKDDPTAQWPQPPSTKTPAKEWIDVAPGLQRKAEPKPKQGRKVRFGDVVAVSLKASARGEVFSDVKDGRFLVGALAVPRCLSFAAATLVEGEKASFEASPGIAFGDAARPLPPRFCQRDDPMRFELEILEIIAVVAKTEDASGPLGQGCVLKQTSKPGAEAWRRPTARSDVTYILEARYVPRAWSWPGDDGATSLVGGCARELLTGETVESRACAEPMRRRTPDPLRVACEACAAGEVSVVAVSSTGAAFDLTLVAFADVEDCFSERAGAVSKRTVTMPPGARALPSELDIVVVRGVVRSRDTSIIACAYGTGQGTVSWRLDDDACATFDSATELTAPLCHGIELAIRRMAVGEVADVTINAPDLAFVRPPSTACAPTAPRIEDLSAFHYGGDRGALAAVADASCYSCPLACRLELVAVTRFGKGLPGDALDRCAAHLNLAEDAKKKGARHYDRSAYARAARRYGDALRVIEDAADALEHFDADPEHAYDPMEPTRYVHDAAMAGAYESYEPTAPGEFDYEDLPKPPTWEAPAEPPRPKKDSLRERRNLEFSRLRTRCLELERLCRLNRSACDLKRCEYQRVCDDCHVVLREDPDDLKALFRGGKALVGVKDYDGARSLFHRCLDVDADCKEAEKALRQLARLESGNGSKKGAFPPARGLGFNRQRPRGAGVAHDRPPEEAALGSSKRASAQAEGGAVPFKARGDGPAHALREMRAMLDDGDGVD